ncbi:MAG: B12-binding domain-containing radical SAM protein [Phycisphaerae bacterium]|nr:B12-binding domain-containing radical SAM protein [Phycisphaerae bacterium]
MDSPPTSDRRRRVALISPKGPLYRGRGGIFGKSLRYMPLTLPTLASLVPDELDLSLTCLDEGITDIDPDRVDADLVAMTVITGTAPRAYELAAAFRRRHKIPVVLGGPHVTLVPDDAAPHADAIVVGYAEQEWPRLLRDFVRGQMQDRYTQGADLDLADAPLPDRSVLPRRRYLTADVFEATRGCIHNCDFCVVPSAWGRRPIQKPIEQVIEDLRRQRARRAIFVDLNIIADRAYAIGLFEALIPLGIQWYGLATTLLGDDEELLDLAARSGCRGLLMGLESVNHQGLRRSRKGFNDPDRYRELVDKLHARRIALQGCFVFGLDDDRKDVFDKTAQFAIEAQIDLPRFAVLTPFPGTPLFDRLNREGRILTRDWSLYDGQHVVFDPAHMSVDELQRGTERAWRAAYNWSAIARRLRGTAAPWYVALLTNYGYRHYARNLHKFYSCDTWFDPASLIRQGGPARPLSATVSLQLAKGSS